MEIAPITAMCSTCHQAWVSWNAKNRNCKCGGKIVDIEPIPNEHGFVYGKFVTHGPTICKAKEPK